LKKDIPWNSIVQVVFSRRHQVMLVVGLLLFTWGGLFTEAGALLLNFVTIIFFFRLAIIIHESGHLFFAKLMGGVPLRMELGTGYDVFIQKFFNIPIVLKSKFDRGLAYYIFKNPSKSKQIIATSGGFIFNFLMAGMAYYIFGLSFNPPYNPAFDFIFTNSVSALFTFFPGEYNKRKTDGLRIFHILSNKEKLNYQADETIKFFRAINFHEQKNYQKALVLYKELFSSENYGNSSRLHGSDCYFKTGNTTMSFKYLQDLQNLIKPEKKILHLYLYNHLAWHYLLSGQTDKAHAYAGMSHQIDDTNVYASAIYGISLIETGKYLQGIKLLNKNINLSYYHSDIFIQVLYLMYASSRLKPRLQKNKYEKYIQKHRPKFTAYYEERIYNRIIPKIQTLS